MRNFINHLYENGMYFHHIIDLTPDSEFYIMHAHEHYELFILISGKGSFMIEGAEYELEPGCAFIMRPAEAHRILIDPSHPYERIVFEFSEKEIKPLDPDLKLLTAYNSRPLGEKNKYPRQTFPRPLIDYITGGVSGFDDTGLRFSVAAAIINFLNHINFAFNNSAGDTVSPRHDVAKELVEYINSHLFEDLSLPALCSRFYMSDSHLGRLFKAATGCSIAKYISIKRLLEARRKIQDGVSASAAAKECGYGDYSAFYRAYIKRFGSSPCGHPKK